VELHAEFDLHTENIFSSSVTFSLFSLMASSPNAVDIDVQSRDKWSTMDDQELDDMGPVATLDNDTVMDDLRPLAGADDPRALVASGDASGDYDKSKDDSTRDRPPKVLKLSSCFVISSCWRCLSCLCFASCWRVMLSSSPAGLVRYWHSCLLVNTRYPPGVPCGVAFTMWLSS